MPTPVSALIHAATMVTAGVYLLMRSSPLIEYSSTVLLICLWLGAITTVFSSLVGLFQQDIKKVIAYSTMSQLGMMVIAVGLSSYNVALFHLINHAFYKGLLFLGAGAVIHAVGDNQDFRKYGGLIGYLPLSYSVMLIASLSLVAFPFMTGFYSKDFILESAFGQYSFSGIAVYTIATIGAIFTTLYSVKVLYLTFLSTPNGHIKFYGKMINWFDGKLSDLNKVEYKSRLNTMAHEGNIYMSLPLVILAIFSIFFGYLTKDIFIGLGSSYFMDNSIFIHPTHEIMIDTEFAVPSLFKLLPFIFTILFSIIAIIFSEFSSELISNFKLSKLGYTIFGFFNQRFLVELFYNKYITNLVLNLGGQTTKTLDKGSIEQIGPYGLEKGLMNLSKNIGKLSTGIPTNYALFIFIGFIVYINLLFLSFYLTLLFILIFFIKFNINNNSNISASVKSVILNFEYIQNWINHMLTLIYFFYIKYYKHIPIIIRILFFVFICLDKLEIAYAIGSQDIDPDLTDTKSGSGKNSSLDPKSESSVSNPSNKVKTSAETNTSIYSSDERSSTVFKRMGDMLHSEANKLREVLTNTELSKPDREEKEDQLSELLEQLSLTDKESSKTLRKNMETSSNISQATKRSGEESSTISKKAK